MKRSSTISYMNLLIQCSAEASIAPALSTTNGSILLTRKKAIRQTFYGSNPLFQNRPREFANILSGAKNRAFIPDTSVGLESRGIAYPLFIAPKLACSRDRTIRHV